jgi:hypothetical protein
VERLNGLIEKFEAAIKAHDAKVAAAKAALEERELVACLDYMDESFGSLPLCSTEMTSSGATGNTEGCAGSEAHTRGCIQSENSTVHNGVKRKHKCERIRESAHTRSIRDRDRRA